MAIQPFATQIQPPQIAAPQPVNQLAQFMQLRNAQQENQLRGMQMAEAQRGLDVRNALRGLDPTSEAYVSDVYRLDPELGSQIEQRKAATRASIISAQQGQLDNLSAKLKMVRDDILRVTNPDQLIGISRQVYSDPDLAPYFQQQGNSFESDVDMVARAVQAGPEAFENLIAQLGGGLDAKVKLEKDRADQRRLQEGERRAESAERRAQDEEDRKKIEFQRKVAAEDLGTYNADAGGFISSTTNKFTPLRQVQETKEAASARKALAQIGYDPNTASDMVTDLIKNSTGSLAGTWVDSLARSVGMGTAGAQNIESLAAIANQMALDLAGGKLGAGFSNEDRDFLRATLGDVANSRKTRSERLAAWNVARDRLIKLAGETKPAARGAGASGSWDAPESKTGGASAQKPAVRSGVTRSGVKFTVEED